MQARVLWTPPAGTLGRLVDRARQRVKASGDFRDWIGRASASPVPPSFGQALRTGRVGVIAELKRRSPSKGSLDSSLDAGQRARLYAEGGAAALSVLTEPSEFGGSLDDLSEVRRQSELPLLRKDFIVHPVQLFEARACGASAALLIVRALGPDDTRILADVAREAGVEGLFEVRNETELGWAVDSGATMIGVNQRNLETLEMEPRVVEHLIPLIPASRVAIAESGVSSRDDVQRAAALGADAVLVGSALSVARNARQAVADMTGVPRVTRHD